MSIPESITDGTNPTYLDPRYEIRRLTTDHIPWVVSIWIHSNVFHLPVMSVLYPDNQTKRVRQMTESVEYMIGRTTESGMSFGVFDTQYEYKRPESASTQGKLYWDKNDLKSDGAELLQQMDYPLVSIAVALDAAQTYDLERMKHLFEAWPLLRTLSHVLQTRDRRTRRLRE